MMLSLLAPSRSALDRILSGYLEDRPAGLWVAPTWKDATGQQSAGTPANLTASNASPFNGSAAQSSSFNGSSSKVDLPVAAFSSLGDFSIEGWMYWTSASAWKRLIDINNGTGSREITILQYGIGSKFGAILVDGSGSRTLLGASAIPTNTWFHAALTLNATTGAVALYGNGALAASNTTTVRMSGVAPTQAQVGKAYDSQWLAGNVAMIGVYPAVLSAARIKAHYLAGINGAL